MTDPSVVVAGAPRQVGVEMMASLYQHRLLSTEQLRAMHCPHTSQQWSRHVLRELRDAGYITSTNKRGSAAGEPMRLWFLTRAGCQQR